MEWRPKCICQWQLLCWYKQCVKCFNSVKTCNTTETEMPLLTYYVYCHRPSHTTSLPAVLDADEDDGLSCIIAAAAADCCCCCACITSCCLAFLPLSRPVPAARSFRFLETALTATCCQIQAIAVCDQAGSWCPVTGVHNDLRDSQKFD